MQEIRFSESAYKLIERGVVALEKIAELAEAEPTMVIGGTDKAPLIDARHTLLMGIETTLQSDVSQVEMEKAVDILSRAAGV